MEEEELGRIERDALHHSATIDAQTVLRLVGEVRRLKGSRREYFAGLAMQGFISTRTALDANISTHPDPYNRLAANAVAAADALLAELEKGGAG